MDLTSMETKRENFERDIILEEKFEKRIKCILGNYFFTKNAYADLKEATDFAIFSSIPVKAAVRLRRYNIYENLEYREQFTIRWWRPNNVKTEIHKIREGLTDVMFYGFVNEPMTKIIQYRIMDMKMFMEQEPEPVEIIPNKPIRDSDFAVYNLSQFQPEFILHYWHI